MSANAPESSISKSTSTKFAELEHVEISSDISGQATTAPNLPSSDNCTSTEVGDNTLKASPMQASSCALTGKEKTPENKVTSNRVWIPTYKRFGQNFTASPPFGTFYRGGTIIKMRHLLFSNYYQAQNGPKEPTEWLVL